MEVRERNQIEEKYRWDTGALYADEAACRKDIEVCEKRLQEIQTYQGKLQDPTQLLALLRKTDEAGILLEKLFVYANMKKDEDGRVAQNLQLFSRVQMLGVEYSSAMSFITPEMTAMPTEKLEELAKRADFADYNYWIRTILRKKQYILSEAEEKLLALSGDMAEGFHDIFETFDSTEVPFGEIEDENGERIRLSHARYSQCLQSQNERVRKDAFVAMYTAYKSMIQTIAAMYAGNIKKDVFFTRARGYDSCLQRALVGEDVDPTVYETLVQTVKTHLQPLHEYMAYRKQAMGKAELHMYDLHVPIVKEVEWKLDFEEAYNLVEAGLSVLGEDYVQLLQRARRERWIDVYENVGKRSGAYSTSAYAAHPFVLLNYEGTPHDAFTIAHELGHALHSYYSAAAQPPSKADYTIFVAEVASTVNEVLLYHHLLQTVQDAGQKKFLLSYYLDMFRTTLYRQTMFAEFELWAHEMQEKKQPIQYENLSEHYYQLNQAYYGEAVVHDDWIRYEWARIPHFYRAFYVYKYATGLTAAVNIAERILHEGAPAVEDYKRFLSSGGSDSPVDLLCLAGVNLRTPQPFERAMASFQETLHTLQKMEEEKA